MPDPNNPIATVQRMFAAFGAGDLDALLETVHPDSRWIYFGANPRLARVELKGRAAVRKFFEGILERLEMTAFNPDEFIVQGDTVVVVGNEKGGSGKSTTAIGNESGKVRVTGQLFRNEWAQKYIVKENQITSMAEYNIQVEPRT